MAVALGRGAALLALVASTVAPPSAAAQVPFTGWQVALSGAEVVAAGRSAPVRGTTLRVRGLAELIPAEGDVRVRFASRSHEDEAAWLEVRSDPEGRFRVAVPVPDDAGGGEPRLELEVGPNRQRFTVPVRVEAAERLILRADRNLYEPGETVHLWGLLRDEATLAPLPDVEVALALEGPSLPPTTHRLTSGPSGVVHLTLTVPEGAPHGTTTVDATGDGRPLGGVAFAVGTRVYDRLLVDVDLGEGPAAPGAQRDAVVTVRTPDGAPVAGASVRASVGDGSPVAATSGSGGRARLTLRAPRYFTSRVGRVPVTVDVAHPGLGSLRSSAWLPLAVARTLEVELVPPHAGLLPDVDEVLFVRVHDGHDHPPPAGTGVALEGALFPGGRVEGQTDSDGLLEVPVRVPRGAATTSRFGRVSAHVRVRVDGPQQRRTRAAVRVLTESEVAPVLDRVVVSPGDVLGVRVLRRPRFRGPVVVELLAGGRPLAVRWLPAPTARGDERVRFDVPPHLGLLRVRARPVLADDVLEGTGASTTLVVRPPSPESPRLTPERARLSVGETARLRLHTTAGRPGYAAVSVRDLAAHGGEEPFEAHFLSAAFDEALLRAAPGGRLVRAALAARDQADREAPEVGPRLDPLGMRRDLGDAEHHELRGVLLDPYPHAQVLVRRGVDGLLRYAEAELTRALARGALGDVAEGPGAARRFRPDLFAERPETTLGGAPVTPALLTAAHPSFTFDAVARRVARQRLVGLILALARLLDPGEGASPAARMAGRAPSDRWVASLRARLGPHALDDPWGGTFALRRARAPRFVLGARAAGLEWVSAGPDGRFGTADDLRDPFERAVPRGSAYADASGEDRLMRALAILPVADDALSEMREAFARTHAEMAEDAIGDLVVAQTSEGSLGVGGLGLSGHGSGGGGGSGFGRGRARRPRIRAGMARVSMSTTASNLARLVRERFPPTLLFRPTVHLDGSGVTEIEVPLADAVTTYVVEAIVWREDGWISAASAHVEADRELVVEAPVPGVAHVGDRLRLPLRVSNRTEAPRAVRLALVGDASIGVSDQAPQEIAVGPHGAAFVPVELALPTAGEGALTVLVTDLEGTTLDAVRRSITVRPLDRRMERTEQGLADGEVTLTLEVPEGATARAGHVELVVGEALLRGRRAGDWSLWPGAGARPPNGTPESHALSLAAAWAEPEIDDETIGERLLELTSVLRELEADAPDAAQVRRAASVLLALGPVHRAWDERPDGEDARALVARLRERVAGRSVSVARDPATWVWSAAALAQTGGDPARVGELLRRTSPYVVTLGEDRWVATEQGRVEPTLLAALAEVGLGRRDEAFRYFATIGRWTSRGHRLDPRATALGRALGQQLMAGPVARSAEVWVDGERARVAIENGAVRHDAPALARPGEHVVRVRARGPLRVDATARFGLPHPNESAGRGPLHVALEGQAPDLDEVGAFTVTVRNRTPRVLARPRLDVLLPTGAELPIASRREAPLDRATIDGDVLSIRLRPLLPGRTVEVPLPLRFRVAGALRGLGVSAFDASRPEDAAVEPPRTIRIEAPEVTR